MIITISGPPGSGKDAAAKRLSERLNLPITSMGNLRRDAAKEKGMTIEEFNQWSLENPEEGDHYFDNFQKKYGQEKDNFIMVSRLGWHFIPHSKKIYIDVAPEIGAERIFNQKKKENQRNEHLVETIEEQIRLNQERIKNDIERYKILYNINPYKKKNYDIIIDSTEITMEETFAKILELLESLKNN